MKALSNALLGSTVGGLAVGLSVFLGFSTAFACPVLTGDYVCDYAMETKTSYSTRVENGTTIYTIDGFDVPADGVVRDLPVNGGDSKVSLSISCDGDTMIRANSVVTGNTDAEVSRQICRTSELDRVEINGVWTIGGEGIQEVNTGKFVCSDGAEIAGQGGGFCVNVDATRMSSLQMRKFSRFSPMF